MATKYCIYARGRWCEVDARTGRVEGFKERPRFLYFKDGKLELASTAKVLRALRALATGAPGCIRHGPPLPQRKRRYRRRSRRERDSRARPHHGCCVHNRCDVNANELSKRPPPAPPASHPRVIYSDDPTTHKPTDNSFHKDNELRNVQQTRNTEPVQIVESSEEEERNRASGVKHNKVADKDSKTQVMLPTKRNGAREIFTVDVSQEKREKTGKATGNRNVTEEDAERLLLRHSDSEDSDKSDKQSDCSGLAKELVIDEDVVIVLRRFLAQTGLGDLDRFDNDEEYKTKLFYKLNPLVTVERCKPLENLLRQKMTLKEFARNLGLRSVAEVTPEKRYRMRPSTKQARAADSETDKENIVKPKRRKLWNNDKELFNSTSRSSDVKPRQVPKPILVEDSSKDTTDSDTEFKRKVREQLARKSKQRVSAAAREQETRSSMVTEKERRTTRSSCKGPGPQQERNKSSESSRLGGNKGDGARKQNSASEDVRRTRSSDRVRVSPKPLKKPIEVSDSSDSAFVASRSSPRKPAQKAVVLNGNAVSVKNRKGKIVKEKKKSDERVEKMKTAVVRSMTVQPVKIKASSVAAGREYTSLEDHAIVAWVSVGGRERRVNGNALWRELQEEYPRITQQNRSWHSLRNRYLRYVLPALGRLALPPQQVSRLRAAAAAGLQKNNTPARRNSIYDAPAVRSASAAAPPPPPSRAPASPAKPASPARPQRTPVKSPANKGDSSSHKTTGRSPRPQRRAAAPPSPSYSTITRKFAARTRARASPSLTSSPARHNMIKRKPNK